MAFSDSYKVYQFSETMEICVLPTDWVNKQGEVKYDSKKASEYIRNQKQPYKKWPTYKVFPICDKIFDTYNRAHEAEKILGYKTDLDTSDIERIYDPQMIINKKRPRKPISTTTSSHDNFPDSESVGSDESCDNIPDPPSTERIIQDVGNDSRNSEIITVHEGSKLAPLTEEAIVIAEPRNKTNTVVPAEEVNMVVNEVIDINGLAISQNLPMTLATTEDINSLKVLINQQQDQIATLVTTVTRQNEKLDSLIAIVGDLTKAKKRGHFEGTPAGNMVINFLEPDLSLPLQNIDAIAKLEGKLQDENVAKDFISFLLQLGGNSLKTSIKFIIQKLYTLELPAKLNYTGREGKYATNSLLQTKTIIEVMQRVSDKSEAQAVDKYMYHMQHVSDRIRSARNAAARAVQRGNTS